MLPVPFIPQGQELTRILSSPRKQIANCVREPLSGLCVRRPVTKEALVNKMSISSMGGVKLVLRPQTLWNQEAGKVRDWSVPCLTILGAGLCGS